VAYSKVFAQNIGMPQGICDQFTAMMQLNGKAFVTWMEDSMNGSEELPK
jgi:hypothetical protein